MSVLKKTLNIYIKITSERHTKRDEEVNVVVVGVVGVVVTVLEVFEADLAGVEASLLG